MTSQVHDLPEEYDVMVISSEPPFERTMVLPHPRKSTVEFIHEKYFYTTFSSENNNSPRIVFSSEKTCILSENIVASCDYYLDS